MIRRYPLPTREQILADGLPAALVDHYRQQASVVRARALGAFLAGLTRPITRAWHQWRERAGTGSGYRETRVV